MKLNILSDLHRSIEGTPAELKRLAAGSNVRVLDRDVALVDGVRFLGATLWTDSRGYAKDGVNENARFDAGLTVEVG